jgi:hypothetical protein
MRMEKQTSVTFILLAAPSSEAMQRWYWAGRPLYRKTMHEGTPDSAPKAERLLGFPRSSGRPKFLLIDPVHKCQVLFAPFNLRREKCEAEAPQGRRWLRIQASGRNPAQDTGRIETEVGNRPWRCQDKPVQWTRTSHSRAGTIQIRRGIQIDH